jgi:FkbM family methyltransferase
MHTLSLRQLFYRALPSNAIILEAGAHIGRDTVKLATYFSHGIIHAFEPVPSLYQQLQNSTAHLPNVHLYPFALSDTNGSAPYFISSGRSTAASSLLEPTGYRTEHPDTQFEEIKVKTVTIDNWAAEYHINRIDGMWLDMQGGELKALQNATHLLPTVTAIFTEISLVERYKNNPLKEDIALFLSKHGFKLVQEDLFKKEWGNALFIR